MVYFVIFLYFSDKLKAESEHQADRDSFNANHTKAEKGVTHWIFIQGLFFWVGGGGGGHKLTFPCLRLILCTREITQEELTHIKLQEKKEKKCFYFFFYLFFNRLLFLPFHVDICSRTPLVPLAVPPAF